MSRVSLRDALATIAGKAGLEPAPTIEEIGEAVRWYRSHKSGDMLRLAKMGERFEAGGKKSKRNRAELDELIARTHTSLRGAGRRVTAREVWDYLSAHDRDGVLKRVGRDTLVWRDGERRQHVLKYGTFRNRLSQVRGG